MPLRRSAYFYALRLDETSSSSSSRRAAYQERLEGEGRGGAKELEKCIHRARSCVLPSLPGINIIVEAESQWANVSSRCQESIAARNMQTKLHFTSARALIARRSLGELNDKIVRKHRDRSSWFSTCIENVNV